MTRAWDQLDLFGAPEPEPDPGSKLAVVYLAERPWTAPKWLTAPFRMPPHAVGSCRVIGCERPGVAIGVCDWHDRPEVRLMRRPAAYSLADGTSTVLPRDPDGRVVVESLSWSEYHRKRRRDPDAQAVQKQGDPGPDA